MAMTIRLSPELDEQIAELAAQRGVSKHQVLTEAAWRYVQSEQRIRRTITNADRVISEHGALLDRLAQ